VHLLGSACVALEREKNYKGVDLKLAETVNDLWSHHTSTVLLVRSRSVSPTAQARNPFGCDSPVTHVERRESGGIETILKCHLPTKNKNGWYQYIPEKTTTILISHSFSSDTTVGKPGTRLECQSTVPHAACMDCMQALRSWLWLRVGLPSFLIDGGLI